MDLQGLLERTLEGLGYEFVALELLSGGAMRVFIDQEGGVDIDDCVRVSNHLTRLFTVENIDYERLEVSSPGLDRPLTREKDFVRFEGALAKIKLRTPLEGQRQFRGRLGGFSDGHILLTLVDGRAVRLPFEQLDKARLEVEL